VTLPAAPTLSSEDLAALVAWRAAFIMIYPEFAAAPAASVQAALGSALTRTPVDVWGEHHALGVYALAAHLVAMSPGGEAMRLSGETTIYQKERARLNRIVASGFRIAGLP
jgi:hypothetical protein